LSVEIHRSARRHGVDDQDITHAVDHALTTSAKTRLAIPAMPMRRTYRRLLP